MSTLPALNPATEPGWEEAQQSSLGQLALLSSAGQEDFCKAKSSGDCETEGGLGGGGPGSSLAGLQAHGGLVSVKPCIDPLV